MFGPKSQVCCGLGSVNTSNGVVRISCLFWKKTLVENSKSNPVPAAGVQCSTSYIFELHIWLFSTLVAEQVCTALC